MRRHERSSPCRPRRCCGLSAAATLLLIASGCQTPVQPAVPPGYGNAPPHVQAFRIADDHLANSEYEQAHQIVAAFQDLPGTRAQLTQARIELEQGRYAAALGRLDSIAQPLEQRATYHRLRGLALEGLGRGVEAASAYEAAYQLAPTPECLASWLDTLIRAGQADVARRILERERYRFVGQPRVHMLTARLYEADGQNEAALQITAAPARSEPFEIRLRLAESHTAAERYDEAIQVWRQLVTESRSARERHRLRRRLADCLMMAERFDEARREFRNLVLTDRSDETAQLGLAGACLLTGEPAEALEAALEVLRDHPKNSNAQLIAALCYQRLNQPARAAALLSETHLEHDSDEMIRELLTRD